MSTENIAKALEYMRGIALTGDQSKARILARHELEHLRAAVRSASEVCGIVGHLRSNGEHEAADVLEAIAKEAP